MSDANGRRAADSPGQDKTMSAKDEALAKITSVLDTLDECTRSREISLARTKLEEARAWVSASQKPRPIEYRRNGDVLVAELPLGALRVELIDEDAAECSLRIVGRTPVDIVVRRPHDRTLTQEATEVLAALYWSSERAITNGGGIVTVK